MSETLSPDVRIGRTTHFINGQWAPEGGETFPVLNPLDDSLVADVAAGGRAEAEAAVAAAQAAFPAGPRYPASASSCSSRPPRSPRGAFPRS
jgi:delta 1-pyrroline-5-carboxylate dehydrogenase